MLRTTAFAVAAALFIGGGAIYLSRDDRNCPDESREAQKAVADAFVSALVKDDLEQAQRYLSSDAEAVRANLPRVTGAPRSLRAVLRRARASTVEACGRGFLELAGAPRDDPCFVYALETTGGGWLRGRKTFRDGDFRVVLGCDGGEWRVKGTLRIE